MLPPLVCCLTGKERDSSCETLAGLLESDEPFDMYILEGYENEAVWQYVESLDDRRIVLKLRSGISMGPAVALNQILLYRKPRQFFVKIESGFRVTKSDLISSMLEVFEHFTELGLLLVPSSEEDAELDRLAPRYRKGVCYLKLDRDGGVLFPRGCQAFRPEVFNYVGYWCEETNFDTNELCSRINLFTPYTAGYTTNIKAAGAELDAPGDWFAHAAGLGERAADYASRQLKIFDEIAAGKRSAYCASILAPGSITSIRGERYHRDWVDDTVAFYSGREQSAR